MFGIVKLNNLLTYSVKHVRQLNTVSITSLLNTSNGFNGSLYIPSVDKNGKFDPTKTELTLNYECPSLKSFQLPLTDIKITDILKRQSLNLPEINKNKEVDDPLLGFQIEQKMPQTNKVNVPMSCNKPMMSEIKWRKRMMNKHKRKKYLKKMFYVIKRRNQAKEKRYNGILTLYRSIHAKKVEAFDAYKYITRELEKAKFFGYRRDADTYDSARSTINSIPSFDKKYLKKFVNVKLPVHLRPENAHLRDNNEK